MGFYIVLSVCFLSSSIMLMEILPLFLSSFEFTIFKGNDILQCKYNLFYNYLLKAISYYQTDQDDNYFINIHCYIVWFDCVVYLLRHYRFEIIGTILILDTFSVVILFLNEAVRYSDRENKPKIRCLGVILALPPKSGMFKLYSSFLIRSIKLSNTTFLNRTFYSDYLSSYM